MKLKYTVFKNKKSGFTLIEVIVIITIMAILAAVIIPSTAGIIKNAKSVADKSAVPSLNEATKLYAAFANKNSGDIFEGVSDNQDRLQMLINSGFLSQEIEPLTKGSYFDWDTSAQQWVYKSDGTSSGSSGTSSSYDLSALALSGFTKSGTWISTSGGLYSENGLLFIPNTNTEYSVTIKAKIGTGTTGGYGILFDTTLNSGNQDTGYCLQLDRGIGDGSVLIRPRVNGIEQSYDTNYVYSFANSFIPSASSASGSAWWTQEHEVKLTVSNVAGHTNTKALAVYIDGQKLFDNYTFTSSTTSSNNYIGFRCWDSSGSTFEELTIN